MSKHIDSANSYRTLARVTDLSAQFDSNERTLRANDYPQDRGIFKRGAVDGLSHVDFFGDTYLTFLQNLGETDLFVHVGPGDFFAEVEYFTSQRFSVRANVLSNAYCRSDHPDALANIQLLEPFKAQGKFSCVDGVKFQDLKSQLKGKAKLVADVFAAGSYDADLFGVFDAASEILVPGGIFAVVLANVTFESASGDSIPASQIFGSLDGYELINHTRVDGWVFRRKDESFIAPKSELVSFVARDPERQIYWPVRHYRIA